jgi:ribosomal protein L29
MKIKDLKGKTPKELQIVLAQERENLRRLRFEIVAGQLKDVSQTAKSKKIIAYILTILKEKHA